MVKVMERTIKLMIGDKDIFIEGEPDSSTQLKAYLDDGAVFFKVLDSDGKKSFYLNIKQTRELCEKLKEIIK